MITLAFSTAVSREYVAIVNNKRVYETSWTGAKDETSKLLPTIEKMLKMAHVKFSDLDRIIVVKGPGQFSALRVGVTTANTLGLVLDIPVFSISTLDMWSASLSKDRKKMGLLPFGTAIAKIEGHRLLKKFPVVPIYLKPPHITQSHHVQ